MPRLVPAGPTGSATPSGETFLGLEAVHARNDYQSGPRIVPVLAVCYARTAHSAGKPSTVFFARLAVSASHDHIRQLGRW